MAQKSKQPSKSKRSTKAPKTNKVVTRHKLSEYERLLADVEPLLKGVLIADLTSKDITFLSGETGIDRQCIKYLGRAAQLAKETDIPAEAFYGWFRQGLPTSLDELLESNLDTLRAALEASVNSNLVPARVVREYGGIIQELKSISLFGSLGQEARNRVLQDLKAHQRINTVTNNAVPAREIMEAGFHSASAVALANRDDFAGKSRLIDPSVEKQHRIYPSILAAARELRQPQTPAEIKLWARLRNRQLADFKFRRQHPIGRFIIDFYCTDRKLCIEIDGDSHAEPDQIEYDQARTQWLNEEGYRVIRFTNREVFKQFEAVLETILEECKRPSPWPSH